MGLGKIFGVSVGTIWMSIGAICLVYNMIVGPESMISIIALMVLILAGWLLNHGEEIEELEDRIKRLE